MNLDRLQRDSQNTIIIHHLEGWPQAKHFKATLAAEFARRNPGQKCSEHLSRVLYPFVNNVRNATYRMVKNSFPGVPEGGTAPVAAILEHCGVLVAELDIKRQMRLLEVRREVERLVVRCGARRAAEGERKRFAELAKEFGAAARLKDQSRFMRADKAFNDLSLRAARNEFAAGAMGLMHGLSRRFWFMHHRQADDTELMATLHGRLARAIADADENAAAKALDALIDHNEAFTRSTVSTEF